ncbi:Glycoside hydrolase, family 47 [Metarhizium album ARSEF 1941]|uniref:alpha-1,2-Mannosidase n=1 Tax=Metarhizium album (strain ARSEF 1941) TaxID=1081103 RepID=A0A0B2WN15_METAS|nr:Glycoside hydrolase, family 47 [Metarhizium album ARSEF 1941]KHN95074.1 Glycoside hydrolase, family 47 [Metarhizium album ARSEF 1941]
MLSLQGPPARRHLALAAFFLLALVLWRGFTSSRPAFEHSGGKGIHYIPSAIDWSRAKIYFPPKDTVPLPSGAPKTLPRVQARTASGAGDHVSKSRRAAVRRAFVKSWNAYKQYAWGRDELMPLSGRGKTTFSGWSAQLVDALDSLWIMGLRDDFRLAVAEVARIDWSKTDGSDINVFEVTIRYLGGLLSAYDLSGDGVLLNKAVELGDALYMAFDTPNRLPTHWLSYTKADRGETRGDVSISGAAGGTLCLEFTRLSQITGDDKYYDATERVKRFFFENQNRTKVPGLWPSDLNFRRGTVADGFFTFGAGADSQYEYLPKMHALLGGLDAEYVEMTVLSLDTGRDKLLFKPMTPKDEDILMSGNLDASAGKRESTAQMQHLTCFLGGTYALAGKLVGRNDYVDLGARLTAGCVWAYDSFPTNVMPEVTELVKCEKLDQPCPYREDEFPAGRDGDLPGGFLRINDARYMLRPEAIESVFYMWRVTGDGIWRDAAWRMWEGIVKETETELAFASIQDASTHGSAKIDSMETHDGRSVADADGEMDFPLSVSGRAPPSSLSSSSPPHGKHGHGHHSPSTPTPAHTHTQTLHENADKPRGMPLRLAAGARRALALAVGGAPPRPVSRATVHASAARPSDLARQNHYERLRVRHDASPGEIKTSFYALSKSHHPDVSRSPAAAHDFSLLAEAYAVLAEASRRAQYDRDVLRLRPHPHPHPPSSFSAGGLSRRRASFRGPPASFYRSAGWGAHSHPERRRQPSHDEPAARDRDPWTHSHSRQAADDVPHFDKRAHARTHRRQDERRWERRRALGDDDVEFEPQTSLAGHFLIVVGILAATMLAPLVYLQFVRLGRRKKQAV